MYKVQKKNGIQEDFDKNKIVSGVIKAGGSASDAERVAAEIETWLPSVAVNNVVNSMDIRTKGLEILKTVNPNVAASFESYRKPV